MTDVSAEAARLLGAARERGQRVMGSIPIPAELDKITAYVGLIGSALELAKLIQTEERDLKIIEAHYSIEIGRINAAFREVEMAMTLSFESDHSLRDKTFELIQLLIAAGQHEIALKFYERMLGGFSKITLDSLLGRRNEIADGRGPKIERR